jgi:hypothetical protein
MVFRVRGEMPIRLALDAVSECETWHRIGLSLTLVQDLTMTMHIVHPCTLGGRVAGHTGGQQSQSGTVRLRQRLDPGSG